MNILGLLKSKFTEIHLLVLLFCSCQVLCLYSFFCAPNFRTATVIPIQDTLRDAQTPIAFSHYPDRGRRHHEDAR